MSKSLAQLYDIDKNCEMFYKKKMSTMIELYKLIRMIFPVENLHVEDFFDPEDNNITLFIGIDICDSRSVESGIISLKKLDDLLFNSNIYDDIKDICIDTMFFLL